MIMCKTCYRAGIQTPATHYVETFQKASFADGIEVMIPGLNDPFCEQHAPEYAKLMTEEADESCIVDVPNTL